MPEAGAQVEIPKRALFKAAEVCDLVKVQPYVLRSWEAEFPDLGITKTAGGPRIYRRADVQQVLRIKHLLLVEGLTLAGARRRLEDETSPVAANAPVIDELIGQNARERLTVVKRGLQSILDLLTGANGGEFRLEAPSSGRPRPAARAPRSATRARVSRGRMAATKRGHEAKRKH
jgi:DNA-binding transcriptional MerR regulator